MDEGEKREGKLRGRGEGEERGGCVVAEGDLDGLHGGW